MESVGFLIFLFILYFIPSFVANLRRHRNENSIFLTNLLLGWTFLGWVVALIWSASDNCRPKPDKTPEQLEKEIQQATKMNWWLDRYFMAIVLLAGSALMAWGIYLIRPEIKWPIPVHDDNLQLGIGLLALGAIAAWKSLGFVTKRKPMFVRVISILLGLSLLAYTGLHGWSIYTNPEILKKIEIEYMWLFGFLFLAGLFLNFGMKRQPGNRVPITITDEPQVDVENKIRKPQLYSGVQ